MGLTFMRRMSCTRLSFPGRVNSLTRFKAHRDQDIVGTTAKVRTVTFPKLGNLTVPTRLSTEPSQANSSGHQRVRGNARSVELSDERHMAHWALYQSTQRKPDDLNYGSCAVLWSSRSSLETLIGQILGTCGELLMLGITPHRNNQR
jgi:hypothetical protein